MAVDDMIIVEVDVGEDPIVRSECIATNTRCTPVYDVIEEKMIERGWVDKEGVVIIEDLCVGIELRFDKDKGNYYFGLGAYIKDSKN